MNTQTIRGNWELAKARLKQSYAILTDYDLDYVEGEEEDLIDRIRQRTGARRDEIERYFEDEGGFHPWS